MTPENLYLVGIFRKALKPQFGACMPCHRAYWLLDVVFYRRYDA